MKAIFLAAGSGTRLHPYTQDRPKWLLPIGGTTILESLVACAHEVGITEICVVRGRRGGNIRCPSVVYVDDQDGLNMVHSLFKAEPHLFGEIVVSYADIIYEPDVLIRLLTSQAPVSVVIDLDWEQYYRARVKDPLLIAESLVLDGDRILQIGQPLRIGQSPCGQYIGLMKFNSIGSNALRETYRDLQQRYGGKPWRNAHQFEQAYMTDLLQELVDRGVEVRAVPIHGGWLEFDTPSDYESVVEWKGKGTLSKFIHLDRMPMNPSVLSAGGILARRSTGEWEVLLVGDGSPQGWRLPKGMQSAGESAEQTALREVLEETGLEAKIVKYVARTGWTYEYGGTQWDERVHFFLMKPIGGSIQDHDAEFRKVQWMPIGLALMGLRYESERGILSQAKSLMEIQDPPEAKDTLGKL